MMWIDCRERQPERYGQYRVIRRTRGGKTEEDVYLWNGSGWVTHGYCLSQAVQTWLDEEAEGAQSATKPEKTEGLPGCTPAPADMPRAGGCRAQWAEEAAGRPVRSEDHERQRSEPTTPNCGTGAETWLDEEAEDGA